MNKVFFKIIIIIIIIILFKFPFLLAAVYTWQISTQRYGNVVTTLRRLSFPRSSNWFHLI